MSMADIPKSNRAIFDLDLLRALVTVADCGSFTVAATRLHSTQSTISQKLRRLEDLAGHRLLDRGVRDVRPTDIGETVLGYARRMLALNEELAEALSSGSAPITLRFGVPEDFAAGRTTRLLAEFSREHPRVKLEVSSGLSRALGEGYDRGELDLVLVKQRRGSREGVACWPEPMCWIDAAASPAFGNDPVPLVAFPPRGLYREDMIDAIEALGRAWRISFTSSSLGGIQAAVGDGLGISLLPARAVTAAHVVLGPESGLPVIDSIELVLLHRPTADPEIKALAAMLLRMLGDAGA
jgi:DNA-binding transcriptional LysR family regulator